MIESGDVLKLDQAHLETVIPQPGRSIVTYALISILDGNDRLYASEQF